MSYTVYTPNVESGPSTYTQHTFASLDELIAWATSLKSQELPVEPPKLKIDTSAFVECGIENATQLKEAIDANDWNLVAKEYMHMLCDQLFVTRVTLHDSLPGVNSLVKDHIKKDPFEHNVSNEDIEIIFSILRELPVSLVCKMIVPGLEELGAVLQEHIAKHVKEVEYNFFKQNLILCGTYIYSKLPIVKELLQIYRFAQFKTVDQSWTPTPDSVQLWATICKEYLSGAITDETRENIMSILFMTYYCSAGKTSIIGSSELFEEFSKMEFDVLPKGLAELVKEGMTYRHVKHALSEIMVGQVRRSDGQRYVGIRRLTKKQIAYSVLSSINDDDFEGMAFYNQWPENLKPICDNSTNGHCGL